MQLWAIIPELIIAGLCMILIPVAGFAKKKFLNIPFYASLIGLCFTIFFSFRMLSWPPFTIFSGTYAIDGLSTVFKILIEVSAVLSLLIFYNYFAGSKHSPHFPVALLFSVLGSICLASSQDLGLIVLFLQMLSISSYLLVGMVRSNKKSNEATLKYFIFAAVALAIMAYGLTFIYGLTGSLDLLIIENFLGQKEGVWIAVSLGLIIIGYGFEITMVPFHFWAPDVYEGTNPPAAAFLSVVPKVAGFAGLMRFLLIALQNNIAHWHILIAVIAAITMTWGNLAALRQKRLKRLLAYSSIAQVGYVLIAVAVSENSVGALASIGYYLAAYIFMNLGAFSVIVQIEKNFGTDHRLVYKGLAKISPFAAITLTLSFLSLAGIPPLAGFAGKVFLIKSAINGGMIWLAIFAAANMALALYYYVKVIAEIYFDNPLHDFPNEEGVWSRLSYLFNLAGIIFLGVAPSFVLKLNEFLVKYLK